MKKLFEKHHVSVGIFANIISFIICTIWTFYTLIFYCLVFVSRSFLSPDEDAITSKIETFIKITGDWALLYFGPGVFLAFFFALLGFDGGGVSGGRCISRGPCW